MSEWIRVCREADDGPVGGIVALREKRRESRKNRSRAW